jgi:hypothetical protein
MAVAINTNAILRRFILIPSTPIGALKIKCRDSRYEATPCTGLSSKMLVFIGDEVLGVRKLACALAAWE